MCNKKRQLAQGAEAEQKTTINLRRVSGIMKKETRWKVNVAMTNLYYVIVGTLFWPAIVLAFIVDFILKQTIIKFGYWVLTAERFDEPQPKL